MRLSLRKCTAGIVGVVTALVLPILLGFVSLGVEVGHWYLSVRQMQGAADAAAISAGAEYVAQYNLGNHNSPTYQTVGQSYAVLNGFNIPISNVCLIDPSGVDGCGFIETLDPRGRVICSTPPCIAVEITQDTMQWLTTKASFEPDGFGSVKPIPTPTLYARSVVSVKSKLTTTNTGVDCILALANDPSAILVRGNADLKAQCGVAVDGGIDQNAGTPVRGGISFNGGGIVNITHLNVAASSTNCPDNGTHCQQFASTAPLPASAVSTNASTPDPYAAQVTTLFANPPPAGVKAISIKTAGSGYTDGTCTFTVTGGTFYSAGSTPVIFTATVSKGKVSKIGSILDPGAYATPGFPTGTVSATSNCDAAKGGSKATFTMTEGCWTWNGNGIAGRKYCSIDIGNVTINFPAGSYWIAGGDSCAGFCLSSSQATVTSDRAGVTFFLTNGEGTSANSLATVSITSGNVTLCAPGTNCGTSCTNVAGPTSCMLFIQNPSVPCEQQHTCESTAYNQPANAINSFVGNGSRTLSGLIYLSRQTFSMTGSGPILGCVGVIAKYLDIGGDPVFSNGCLPGGGIGGTTVTTTLSNPYLSQ